LHDACKGESESAGRARRSVHAPAPVAEQRAQVEARDAAVAVEVAGAAGGAAPGADQDPEVAAVDELVAVQVTGLPRGGVGGGVVAPQVMF